MKLNVPYSTFPRLFFFFPRDPPQATFDCSRAVGLWALNCDGGLCDRKDALKAAMGALAGAGGGAAPRGG